MAALLLPLAKVRLQSLANARVQGRPDLFAEGSFVQRQGFLETLGHEQANRPGVQVQEEPVMTDQELAEVHRDSPVHQVEEDESTGVLLLNAYRQLVGKAADGLAWP